MILFKVNNENHCDIRYLNQKYPNIVYGILGNKPVAVNYDANTLYVDFDKKVYATTEHEYDKGFYESDIRKFINTFPSDIPNINIQRKTDFYKYIEYLKNNGFKEIVFMKQEE